MRIQQKDISRVRGLLTVAQNKDKKDNVQFLEGYIQCLEDYKGIDENVFEKLCNKILKKGK